MKKTLLFFLLFFSAMCVRAQGMRQVWLSMPDSLIGYINQSKRIEALDYRDMGLKLDVKNLLNGSTLVDTLTADFMEVRLSEASLLQMKLLAAADSDSIVCTVRTYIGPERESTVKFYTRSWQPLPAAFAFPAVTQLVQKPDTMSEARFAELRQMIEPALMSAALNIGDETLTVALSVPMLNKDEKAALRAILRQRKYKWDGQTFK